MKKIFLYKNLTGKAGGSNRKNVVLSDEYAIVDDEDFDRINQHKC